MEFSTRIQINFLYKLYFTQYDNIKNAHPLPEFARELGVDTGRPDLKKIFEYLIEQDALIFVKRGYYKLDFYFLDKKKLKYIIENQPIYKEALDFAEKSGGVIFR